MRATSLLSNLLQLNKTRIVAVGFDRNGVVVDVAPRSRTPRCSGCLRSRARIHDRRSRRWRHLDLAGMKLFVRYDIARIDCAVCGVVVELVPWAAPGSWFTYDFETTTGHLLQNLSTTAVAKLMRTSWRTVGEVARRVVERMCEGKDELDGLRRIGIDELSYRRHHEYVTVVVDHDRRRVVWAAPGKNAATVAKFLEQLGTERSAAIELVTIDMSAAYIKAVTEHAPKARLVFDRFHVQRLAHEALDEVRREQMRSLEDDAIRRSTKRTRYALQKNPWNMTRLETETIANLQQRNKPLYRAYLLKESLAEILDRRQVGVAGRKLDEWIAWAARSRLGPFVKLARTMKKYRAGILGYVQTRKSNGLIEGLNGKIRTITRRAYGLHSASALIALIFLCCAGLTIDPVHVLPLNV